MKTAAKAEIENKVLLATSISQTIWSIGAGCSTLPCSAKDLKHVLQLFDKDIPNIKDAYEVKTPDDRVWPKVASTFPEELIRQHKVTTTAGCEIESGRLLILCVGKGPLPYLFQPCTIGAAWRPLDDRFIVTTAVLLLMTFSYGRVERL